MEVTGVARELVFRATIVGATMDKSRMVVWQLLDCTVGPKTAIGLRLHNLSIRNM
jgi:hypothetical protein